MHELSARWVTRAEGNEHLYSTAQGAAAARTISYSVSGENQTDPGLPRRAAAARRHLQVVRRQIGQRLRQHDRRASRPTPASSATARSVRSDRSTCRPTPTACARAARARAAPARRRSARAGQAESPHGRRAQGTSLRQVGHRHRLLGHSRPGDRPAGVRAAGRPLRRRRSALSRHLAGIARGDGGERRRLSRPRATGDSSSRSAAIPTSTSSASAPSRRSCSRAIAWSPTPTPAGRSTRRCASSRRCATSTSTSSSPA